MATKVNGLIQKVNPGDGTQYSLASTAYGYCETAAGTAAKVVDMTGFTLLEGTTVHIKFKEKNSASSPTLNINGTGAKNIVQYGTTAVGTSDSTNGWYAGAVIAFTYDGTSWVRDQGFNTNSTYYVESIYTSTAAGTAAKVGTGTYNLEAGKYFQVLVINSNTAASALTLNINGKGAKPIYINGTASSSSNYTLPAGYYMVYYDGTNYYFRTDYKLTGSITGTASNVTGTVGIDHGGTGATTAANAWTALGGGASGKHADNYYALAEHTHTISLAEDTGTSTVTLAHGGKYKLTAGGTNVIFTMPSDNNTTYTFENGTNGFTVTPSGGSAQTVTVTPSITNNITGTGANTRVAYYSGANTLTSDADFVWDATNNKLTAAKLNGYVMAGQKSGTTLGTQVTAEGDQVTASGDYVHAEGVGTIASGNVAHAEGQATEATGSSAHAEGYRTTASGSYSHAEGKSTTASGAPSHAEGQSTISSAWASHAEGLYTTASGDGSHAEGFYTIAQRAAQHVFGLYNIADEEGTTSTQGAYVEIVGNGTSTTRSNARTLDWSGNEALAGGITLATDKVTLQFNTTTNALDFIFA